MKYTAIVSTDYFIYNNDEEVSEWNEEDGESVEVGKFETIKEAYSALCEYDKNGLYHSWFITTYEDGEIWSSIAEQRKCECCGSEEWETLQNKLPEDE